MRILRLAEHSSSPFDPPEDFGPAAEYLEALADTLRLHAANDHNGEPGLKQKIALLPSRYNLQQMSTVERELTLQSIRKIWKQVTSQELPEEKEATAPQANKDLDGNFWLLPGGILVRGYNHYTSAKKHKGMFCSLLNINSFIFEHHLAADPNRFIGMLLENGAVRAHIDREGKRAIFQCTSQSWPVARNKMSRMLHQNRIIKVVDPSRPYHGWKSGIPVLVNSRSDYGNKT